MEVQVQPCQIQETHIEINNKHKISQDYFKEIIDEEILLFFIVHNLQSPSPAMRFLSENIDINH